MTNAVGTDAARAAGYPVISPRIWWQLRKQFQKGMPKVFDADYLITISMRQNEASANNLVRPFVRFGLFNEDGRPELAWDWIEDAKYPEVCRKILQANYPDSLTSNFASGAEDERVGVERWFQRTAHLAPASARQYAAFYMLLAKADPSEQEAALGVQPAKVQKAVIRQIGTARSRPLTANAQPAPRTAQEPAAPVQPSAPEGEQVTHALRTRHARGTVEPTLNINVQIHIPAEATPDQIEQIFKSMARHLYQRQDGADE